MINKINIKFLFYISLVLLGYFSLLYLNGYIIKSDSFVIEFLQELLTVPMLLIELVLFFLALVLWVRDKFSVKSYSFWTFLIVFISSFFTWGSFLILWIV